MECPEHSYRPMFFMSCYDKRWVFTEVVLESEWGIDYHRVWFTHVYELYTFDTLHPPSRTGSCTTISKEGYLLDRLVSGRNHRSTFEECVAAWQMYKVYE